MILLILSGVMFLGGGYTWLKVFNAFRSRRSQKRPLVEAEIGGIVIGFGLVGAGVVLLLVGLKAISTAAI